MRSSIFEADEDLSFIRDHCKDELEAEAVTNHLFVIAQEDPTSRWKFERDKDKRREWLLSVITELRSGVEAANPGLGPMESTPDKAPLSHSEVIIKASNTTPSTISSSGTRFATQETPSKKQKIEDSPAKTVVSQAPSIFDAPKNTENVLPRKCSAQNAKPAAIMENFSPYWKDIKSKPSVKVMADLLRLSGTVPPNWEKSADWVRKKFCKTFHPDHLVYSVETSGWGFSKEYQRLLKARERVDRKDLRLAKDCGEMLVRRHMPAFSVCLQSACDEIQAELGKVQAAIDGNKYLQNKQFLAEVHDCLNRMCRVPLSFDVVLGGRDKGGSYQEYTQASQLKLITAMMELCSLDNTKAVLEVGHGLATMAAAFSLIAGCKTVGCEIEPSRYEYSMRSYKGLQTLWETKCQPRADRPEYQPCGYGGFEEQDKAKLAMLEDCKKRVQNLPRLIRLLYADAMDVPMDSFWLIHTNDEAFNDEDCVQLAEQWLSSSCPFYACVKAIKRPSILKRILESNRGMAYVVGKVPVTKTCGGGSSTVVILGKRPLPLCKCPQGVLLDDYAIDDKTTLARLYPMTTAGWRDEAWVPTYRTKVVEPILNSKPTRPIRGLHGPTPDVECCADLYMKCDPNQPGADCTCSKTFQPMPPEITYVSRSTIHGSGFFTRSDILANKIVCFYTGEVTREKPIDCTYTACVDRYFVNAKYYGPHRFLNHSCEPNCRLQEIVGLNAEGVQFDLALVALRNIHGGEELTIDYGMDTAMASFGSTADVCGCKSARCRYEANRLFMFAKHFKTYPGLGGRKSSADVLALMLLNKKHNNNGAEQDLRDQYRHALLSEKTQTGVYTVALDTRQKNPSPRHMDCDVSNPTKFLAALLEKNVRYQKLYPDWVWTPLTWWETHVPAKFFHEVLPLLVEKQILLPGAAVFLPFNPHTFRWVLEPQPNNLPMKKTLKFSYEAELLAEDQLDEHELWQALKDVDDATFHRAFGKSLRASEQQYITFDLTTLKSLLPPIETHSCVAAAADKLNSIVTDLSRIRFIKLTVVPKRKDCIFPCL